MSCSPLEFQESLEVGQVDFVSPDEIKIQLNIDAPEDVSLSTGLPRVFPRINGYVLIHTEDGYVVGQIEWITIEKSPYPKRQGLGDFGLVDLPFPMRKMSVKPLGVLREKESSTYSFQRGVSSFPSVGDNVLLPTEKQLKANSGIVTVYDGCFSFKHRAILEFLYARRKALEKTLPINEQMLTLNWQNVYYFYYGCLKDCPDEIKAFKDLECSNTFEKMMKLFFAPNFLLAAYNTPYNVISETLSSAFNESGHIYLEMKKDADCPFLRFSEMNFLWFFQMLMRNLYSYNFFRDAIEKYLVDVDSKEILEPDAYTLFFISMIRVTLKIDKPTDFLFDKQNKLPAQIKLGLFHEVKSEKDLSEKATTYIKKMTNKLKKNGFADKGFLKTLYNEPLTIKAKKKV